MIQVLLTYLLIPFALLALPARMLRHTAVILGSFQLAVFAFFLMQVPVIREMGILGASYEWIPALGLHAGFLLDGLGLSFALLITGIGSLIFFYAHAYMKGYTGLLRFYFYLSLFSSAMLGLVLSENLIQLFVFWELTSVLSFLLISFFHEKPEARKAAFQSLYITGFGGLSLLAGILLLGSIPGSYEVSDWILSGDQIRQHTLYTPGLVLILIGVFTKSAQFPFHFWLPGAMQAPSPVSAFLHSATMVKAGFFLLLRLSPALAGTGEWNVMLTTAGAATMLIGAYLSITQTDIKAILAYTTINALGTLVLLTGIDTKLSLKAAMIFLFVHAMYKATLFMIAGLLEKKTGTRDLHALGGLRKFMPITFWISILAAFSMAGLPPMLGFLGKELIYEAKVQLTTLGAPVLVMGVLSNILMVTVSLSFLYKIFLGKAAQYAQPPHEKKRLLLLGPAILVLVSLILGVLPEILGKSLIDSTLRTIHPSMEPIKWEIWHGFNTVFFLSVLTVLAGLSLSYWIIKKDSLLDAWRRLNQRLFFFRFTDVFSDGVDHFINFSKRKETTIQHGYHRYYILTIIILTAALMWAQIYFSSRIEAFPRLQLQPFYISGLILVVVLATIYSTLSMSRIATIIGMGITGYGISLIYLYYSAVDLAITQVLVETLTVVMFVLVLPRLPRFANLSRRWTKVRDLGIALVFGTVMTFVALQASVSGSDKPVSAFYLDNSLINAYGKNVVNVILVDFRALDTFGEVVVLVVAALGVFVLIKGRRQ
ncbi:MAG: DUF4040 domain-containing protein [Lentimicrobiaceae bacterium]|nr:DUF4040 domain-containing protein [Lentimicrobiaceae bacterium]